MTNSDTRERAVTLAKRIMDWASDSPIDKISETHLAVVLDSELQSLEAEVAANSYGTAAQRLRDRGNRRISARGGMGQIFAATQDQEALDCADVIASLTPHAAQDFAKRREREIESITIMRFRKMLNRIGIHGYYNEMQNEFDGDALAGSAPGDVSE